MRLKLACMLGLVAILFAGAATGLAEEMSAETSAVKNAGFEKLEALAGEWTMERLGRISSLGRCQLTTDNCQLAAPRTTPGASRSSQ